MNAGIVVNRMYELLDASGSLNLAGWEDSNLYSLVNDALRRICLDTAIIGAAGSQSVVSPAVTATLPTSVLSVLEAAWNGECLEIVEVRDLDNEAAYWAGDASNPEKIAFEQQGFRTARLSPNPTATGTLQTVTTQAPPTLDSFTSLNCPDLVETVCLLEAVASARRQVGLHQQLDTAASLQAVADLLKDSLQTLYGRAM